MIKIAANMPHVKSYSLTNKTKNNKGIISIIPSIRCLFLNIHSEGTTNALYNCSKSPIARPPKGKLTIP